MMDSGPNRPKTAFREGMLVFLAALFCVGLHQTQPGLVEREDGSRSFGLKARSLPLGDSPYNIRLAYLYRTGDVAEAGREFHWMSSSIWAHNFCDKEFLYHLYLAPFTLGARNIKDTGALIWGAKIATSLMFALLALTLWAVLRGFGVRHAWCYVPLIVLLGGIVFCHRAEETRAWPLGVICSLTAWLMMARNRRLALLLVAAIFTLGYSAVHFLIMLWFVRAALALLLRPQTNSSRRAEFKQHLWLLGAILAGIALGVLLHPGRRDFANMWVVTYLLVPAGTLQGAAQSTVFELFAMLNISHGYTREEAQRLQLGTEFLPRSGANLILAGGAAMFAPLALALASAWRRHKPSRETMFALGAAMLTLAMFINSARFAEIMGPFMALACGLWMNDLLTSPRVRKQAAARPVLFSRLGLAARTGMLVVFAVMWTYVLADAEVPMPRPWRDAALWLRDNPQARGKVLFHSRWDVFPDFIFYAPNCDYIVGMDPNYLLAHDVGKSRLYWDIFEDKVDSTTVDRIRREFGASFILVMPPHTPGLDRECRRQEELGKLRLAYVDPNFMVVIYQVVE